MSIIDFLRHIKHSFVKFASKLGYPDNGKVLIHLGCGKIDDKNYINVDVRHAKHIHHVCSVGKLSVFPSNYADMIYACHVLEHIGYREIDAVLLEWYRVLKKGGVLRVSVPDFEKLLTIYSENHRDIRCILPMLMGAQDYVENQHRVVFNKEYLCLLLKDAGYVNSVEWDPSVVEYHDFEDWASRKISIGDYDYNISLNIEATK